MGDALTYAIKRTSIIAWVIKAPNPPNNDTHMYQGSRLFKANASSSVAITSVGYDLCIDVLQR